MNVGVVTSTEFNTSKSVSDTEATSVSIISSVSPRCIEENELLITERDESGTKYSTIKQLLPNSEITMGEIGELWTRGLLRGVPVSW